jgi:hypothetical protein
MRSERYRLIKLILGLEKFKQEINRPQLPQTFVFQVFVREENYMGDKIEMTGNIQDSIVNVKPNLNAVDQSINQFSETNLLFESIR